MNNLLFDVLSLTSKKIGDISKCNMGSCDRQEGSISFREYEADAKSGREALSQLQHLIEPSHSYNHDERRSSVEKLSALIGKIEREQSMYRKREKRAKTERTLQTYSEQSDCHGQRAV